ncbi:MAG: hypothetical protein V7L14_27650 [Nostoc sp.]|uniref:hypothetical protein n=1 Tax=unclassified Nostoc TaxID=2593658 RepID=UPI0025E7BC19|nr:hypothetical protein [Nostoc sp. NOS(2021)]MBN3897640.1 hypothetical protein [Nostoc sp. NOS(2021)]
MSTTGYAYALQKTSKIKRSPFRKSQKQSDRLLDFQNCASLYLQRDFAYIHLLK